MARYRVLVVQSALILMQAAVLGCNGGSSAIGNSSTQGTDVTTPAIPSGDSVPVPFSIIAGARTQSSVHNETARVVIRDLTEWERYWAQIVAQVSPAPATPAIDFTRHFVVAASMGQRPSGGYTIDITGVYQRAGVVYVVVKSTSPGPMCGVAAVMTAPVVAATVERVEGAVQFIETSETIDCE